MYTYELELDGIIRCPAINRYAAGGIFFYEVVLSERGLKKLTAHVIGRMVEIESHPIELKHNLDGSLTLRGFPRLVYSRERAHFEATLLLGEFQKAAGLDLAIAETKSLHRH